jgi:hypothetical protein
MIQTTLPLLTLLLTVPSLALGDSSIPVTLKSPAGDSNQVRLLTTGDDSGAIEIRGDTSATTTRIAEIDHPEVKSHFYTIRGRVKYRDVTGQGYLELWSKFGPSGEFFTRTLADAGPMQVMSGTSDWRDFELPFLAEAGMRPARLTVNVVLPGEGTVQIKSLTIHSQEPGWWSPRQGGFVGGIGGGTLGLCGAIIGILAARRKTQQHTILKIFFLTGITLGGIILAIGMVAFALGQPYHVVYPLLLLGTISVFVLGMNLVSLLRKYREDEMRRISALDT